MFWLVVRSVKAGIPVATSSLRKKRAAGDPTLPSPAYMRVLPLGNCVTANSARSVFCVGLSAIRICVQVFPPSLDRQIPPMLLMGGRVVLGNAAAYTVLGLLGSTSM